MFTQLETHKKKSTNRTPLTFTKLKMLIKRNINSIKNSVQRKDMASFLNDSGYSSHLRQINFNQLTVEIWSILVNKFIYSGMTFDACNLPSGGKFTNCQFFHCDFFGYYNTNSFKHNVFYVKDDSEEHRASTMAYKGKNNLVAYSDFRNPVIGVVYFEKHGIEYTDKIIKVLQQYKITVLKLCPIVVAHQMFNDLSFLDGIVLAGGVDVITDSSNYSSREKLESQLLKTALQYHIPTLGVCRGHQFIGHYFGAKIKDVPEHAEDTIFVPRDKDSKLFALTEKKFEAQTRKRKLEKITQEDNGYKYTSYCAHRQGLFFKVLPSPDKKFKITARAEDGLAECLEVGDHIISFQHHHEALQNDSIAKSAMAMFMEMVITYHENKAHMDDNELSI